MEREEKGGSLKSVFYTGPSMNPTLTAGDFLSIKPYGMQKIRRGDVVVFKPPDEDRSITHRVISVEAFGTRTRGDNNSHIDQWIISPNHIVGKVTHAQRGNKRRRILGGRLGIVYSSVVHFLHRANSWFNVLLHPLYRWLAQKGIFRHWLPFGMRPRVVSFERPGGTELKLLMGRYIIGRLLPQSDRWWIKRPFRLFVDEASIPRRDSLNGSSKITAN